MVKLYLESLCAKLRNIANSPYLTNNPVNVTEMIKTRDELLNVSSSLKDSRPELSQLLEVAAKDMIRECRPNTFYINPFRLGAIIAYLDYSIATFDSIALDFWQYIHPRIRQSSKALFTDQHFADSVNDAFIEIADRVRKLFVKLRPSDNVPTSDVTLMTTVFSDNKPIIEICDRSTQSGRDTQKGFMQMISGAFSAIRNPKSHSNFQISEEDAVRKLMLASMLMYKIDDGVSYSNIKE